MDRAPARFRWTDDYWTRALQAVLKALRYPLWVLNARNDPFVPLAALPRADEVSARHLECPTKAPRGFVAGPFPGHLDWLPRRLLDWFGTAVTPSHPASAAR